MQISFTVFLNHIYPIVEQYFLKDVQIICTVEDLLNALNKLYSFAMSLTLFWPNQWNIILAGFAWEALGIEKRLIRFKSNK